MAMRDPKIKVLYVDAEFALNRDRAKAAGVDLTKIKYLPSSQLEEVANYIVENVAKFDLIVIDSLAALTPMSIGQNDVGTSSIGLAARQIGHFIAKLRPKLYESNTAIVGINQVRANLGFGAAETQAFGGWSWGHAIDLSLKLYKGGANQVSHQEKGDKVFDGHYCNVKVDKSRIGDWGAETKFLVNYKIGSKKEPKEETNEE
jgi:recombination protein RecA